jgi:hypothetical protein
LTVDGAGCHDASAISEAKQEEGSVKSSDSRNEKYRQRYRDAVQPHLSEPLLALGVFNRPGGIQAIGMAKVSPLLSMAMRKSAKKQAGGHPTSVALAVTPTECTCSGSTRDRAASMSRTS